MAKGKKSNARIEEIRKSIVCRRVCPRCEGDGELLALDPKKLRMRRKALALSLRELARRTKVSASYLVDLELGRRVASVALIDRICTVLGTA